MKTATVVNEDYIGDILFSSSIAKELKEQLGYDKIFYVTRFVQPEILLRNNPYIDGFNELTFPRGDVFRVSKVDQSKPVTIQYQEQCGIPIPRLEYTVYLKHQDLIDIFSRSQDVNRTPMIAIQRNWIERVYQFTKEEYWRGIDVPYKGYGGRIPDLNKIIVELNKKYNMIYVGGEPGVSQFDSKLASAKSYYETAKTIASCDYMLGSESGLTNLAAGLNTRCIITTCFIAQLYGPNGLMKKIQNPQMGPAVYFPNAGHSHLNPFLTENEIIDSIIDIIDNNRPTVYDWNELRPENV